MGVLVIVESIHSGMNHGLTMVVGPPGTGKTDVAVQTIANLYHNNPTQHTLIVTHSNQALNQIFEKLTKLGKCIVNYLLTSILNVFYRYR